MRDVCAPRAFLRLAGHAGASVVDSPLAAKKLAWITGGAAEVASSMRSTARVSGASAG